MTPFTPKTLPNFGDYVSIEQKRFGVPNEFYTHKVIGCMESNSWIDVPAVVHKGATLHDTSEPVVNVICCGVCEDAVLRYRVADVKVIRHAAQPLAVATIPEGMKITEEMHIAAVKVLHRASGVDGLPQRMLDAMLAVAPQPPAGQQDRGEAANWMESAASEAEYQSEVQGIAAPATSGEATAAQGDGWESGLSATRCRHGHSNCLVCMNNRAAPSPAAPGNGEEPK